MLSTGKATGLLVIGNLYQPSSCSAMNAGRKTKTILAVRAEGLTRLPTQRAAIYNYQCCMSSAPCRNTIGIQVRLKIRLDIGALRLYRALSARFVMVATL